MYWSVLYFFQGIKAIYYSYVTQACIVMPSLIYIIRVFFSMSKIAEVPIHFVINLIIDY